jgi:predicted nuclease with TOPRIM domain
MKDRLLSLETENQVLHEKLSDKLMQVKDLTSELSRLKTDSTSKDLVVTSYT